MECIPIPSSSPDGKRSSMARKATDAIGLVIVDRGHRLVSANSEALKILWYPAAPSAMPSPVIDGRIPSLLDGSVPRRADGTTEFVSGRRRYDFRRLTLEPLGDGSRRFITAVLLQRRSAPTLPAALSDQYGLTRREQEVIELVMQGLTSKEIAERKQLSPNTVKAFLRLIMIKMQVKTRAAVVGRIFATLMTSSFTGEA